MDTNKPKGPSGGQATNTAMSRSRWRPADQLCRGSDIDCT